MCRRIWFAIMFLILFFSIFPDTSLNFSPSTDVEYIISVNLGMGGSVLVKAKTYGSNVLRFLLHPSVAQVIEIVDASSQIYFDRQNGVIDVYASDEWIWFNYTFPRVIWHYVPGENRRILCAEVDRDVIQFHFELFLPHPDFHLERGNAILTLKGIPDDWFIIMTYDERKGNTFYFHNINTLFDTGLQAAKLYYLAQYCGSSIHFYAPFFYGMLGNETFRISFLGGAWDVKGMLEYKAKVLGRGLEMVADILGVPVLSPVYLYPGRASSHCPDVDCEKYHNDMRLPCYVMFHDDEINRWGHYIDHFIMPYVCSSRFRLESTALTSAFWEKAVRLYLGYVVASQVANDTTFISSILITTYLAHLRLQKLFTKFQIQSDYKDYINDVYAPLSLFYLDSIVKELSNCKYSIFNIIGKVLCEHQWEVATTNDIVEAGREFGIDLEPYIGQIESFDLNINKLKSYLRKGDYWKHFHNFLDKLRENSTLAPDTLLLAYLDYVIWSSECDHIEGFYSLFSGYYYNFISKLYPLLKDKSITESTFIDALNQLTNGYSSDFFDFYSNFTDLKLSIGEVQAFFNGTYPHILGRIVAAKNILREMPNSNLNSLLGTAYNELKSGRYSDALKDVNKVLSQLALIKRRDSDGDSLPDWIENKYGTDPQNPDTNNNGILDAEEVFFGRIVIDGDLSDWKVNKDYVINVTRIVEVDGNPYPGNLIKSIAVAYDDNYLYLALKVDDSPFSIQNMYAFSIDLDANWDTVGDRIDIAINSPLHSIIGEMLQGNIFLGDVLELRLPLYMLKLFNLSDKFIIMFGGRCKGVMGLPMDVESLDTYWIPGIDVMVDLTSLTKLPSKNQLWFEYFMSLKRKYGELEQQYSDLLEKYSELESECNELKSNYYLISKNCIMYLLIGIIAVFFALLIVLLYKYKFR